MPISKDPAVRARWAKARRGSVPRNPSTGRDLTGPNHGVGLVRPDPPRENRSAADRKKPGDTQTPDHEK